jgi:hypothetical protein
MGLKLVLKDVEVLSSDVTKRKIWPNTAPGREKYELTVRIAKGTLAHRDLLDALETAMRGTAVDGLRPSIAKQKAASHPQLGDIALAEMCSVSNLKVKNAHTLRDPEGQKTQLGKLSKWADSVLEAGDFMLTARARNRAQVIDESAHRYDGEVNGCIVDVYFDVWVRKGEQKPGISFEFEGIRIKRRVERTAPDIFGMGDGDVAYDFLPVDLVSGDGAGSAPVVDAPVSDVAPTPPKDDAFGW